MSQLAGGDTVYDEASQPDGEAQPNTKRMKRSAYTFRPLVQHQIVKPTSQAGDQRKHH